MLQIKLQCPNQACKRGLQVRAQSQPQQVKLRCPACATSFAVQLRKSSPPPEEEVGTYGIARETSLPYLLQREHHGFKLTAQEKADKRRLLAEHLAADPGKCPDCGERKARRNPVCGHCGFNVATGRRPRPQARPALGEVTAGVVIDEETAEVIVELAIEIIVGIIDASSS